MRYRARSRRRYDVTVPVVVGALAFAILVAGLGYVRQVGKSRPHAK